ncbi:MAG: hypothetical protein RL117_780 [Verrucomicrobiota bacterium]|jgi:hypothetical protein
MKRMMLPLVVFACCFSSAWADVLTFQGSSRWRSTLMQSGSTTSVATTSYITYTVLERDQGNVVNQVKIDAWAARNPLTGKIERWYYIDEEFRLEFGYFGQFGTDVGGGMQFTGVDAVIPFRGTSSAGVLTAFVQIPTADYLTNDRGLDITEISGSGRLNRSFSGDYSLSTVVGAIRNLLESRGYWEAR